MCWYPTLLLTYWWTSRVPRKKADTWPTSWDGKPEETSSNSLKRESSSTTPNHKKTFLSTDSNSISVSFTTLCCKTSSSRSTFQIILMTTSGSCMELKISTLWMCSKNKTKPRKTWQTTLQTSKRKCTTMNATNQRCQSFQHIFRIKVRWRNALWGHWMRNT